MTRRTLAASLFAASLIAAPARIRPVEEMNADLQKAIQSGDAARMKMLLDEGAEANSKDSEGVPALMNAALYGSAAHMKLLIDRGASVNARNPMDATALIWAAADAAKARMLVEKGADVNAQSKLGRTPLMVAASVAGNVETVKLLLAKGARVDTRDQIAPMPIIPAGGGKGTALIDSARVGDAGTVRALLAAGADVKAVDARNGSPLSEAVVYGRRDLVAILLEAGAEAAGRVTTLQLPYMTLAAIRGDVDVARMLYRNHAEVSAADVSGSTPLMFAAAAENDNVAMVEFLLNAGAEVNTRNKAGETAIDWALRRGETAIVKMLRQAGAETGAAPQTAAAADPMGNVPASQAVQTALAALGKSAPVSFKKTGCASCHNHTLPMVAFSEAARKGIAVDAEAAMGMKKMTLGMMTPMMPLLLEGSDVPPDMQVTGSYMLEALRAQGHAPNRLTAGIVHKVAQNQMADGRWVGWAPRAPMESGDIQATAMSIRSLKMYPLAGRQAEMDQRIAKARKWLMEAKPATTEEFIMRLEGLRESGAPAAVITDAARQLTALQRDGGGWAQLPGLKPDAYATGKALVALTRARAAAGGRKAGVQFLRSTQQADGSWQVTTRSFPLQPLVDGGFPHGRDQWISAAATSWAAQALAMNVR